MSPQSTPKSSPLSTPIRSKEPQRTHHRLISLLHLSKVEATKVRDSQAEKKKRKSSVGSNTLPKKTITKRKASNKRSAEICRVQKEIYIKYLEAEIANEEQLERNILEKQFIETEEMYLLMMRINELERRRNKNSAAQQWSEPSSNGDDIQMLTGSNVLQDEQDVFQIFSREETPHPDIFAVEDIQQPKQQGLDWLIDVTLGPRVELDDDSQIDQNQNFPTILPFLGIADDDISMAPNHAVNPNHIVASQTGGTAEISLLRKDAFSSPASIFSTATDVPGMTFSLPMAQAWLPVP